MDHQVKCRNTNEKDENAHSRVGEKLAGRGPAGALCSRLIGSGRGVAGNATTEVDFTGSLAQTQSGQGAERIRTATSFRNGQEY
jgi:hypothetical protein